MFNDNAAPRENAPGQPAPMFDGTPTVRAMVGENPLHLAARTWEAEVHTGGWDQPNQFAFAVRIATGPDVGLGLVAVGAPFRYDPATLVNALIDQTDPDQIRYWLDDIPGLIHATGCVTEAWLFPNDTRDPAVIADRLDAFRAGTVYQHPDRVEGRVVYLTDVTGATVTVVRIRNRPVPELLDLRADVAGPIAQALTRWTRVLRRAQRGLTWPEGMS